MSEKYGFIGDRPYISTVKGNRFYLDDPQFNIDEMAHALAMICRYGGHCRRFFCVAEHSILVAMICEQLELADPYEGLMHDGHEGYLLDLPKPWKAALPGYVELERRLESSMRIQFGLPPEISKGAKTADLVALALESRLLLPNQGKDFEWPEGILGLAGKLYDIKLNCWPPEIARSHFIATYNELRGIVVPA
jgi:uncharacterized protein